MTGKGVAVTVPEKELIVRLKKYFDKNKKSYPIDKQRGIKGSVYRTATALQISLKTVSRVMAEYNKEGVFSPLKKKGSKPYAVNENVKTLCQDIIRSHNIQGEHISLRLLVGILNDEHDVPIPRETLRSYLHRWGVIYGSILRHTALRERDYVVNARRSYLLKKREVDASDRPCIYLDETFINKNYTGSEQSWYCENWNEDPFLDKSFGPYINKPSGKGGRYIILNAVTENGWVDGARLVFKAKSNTGDYHGSMDENNFTKWFTTQLLPNIPDNSVVIMDNASYHNVFSDDGVPSLTSKKTELQKWLTSKNIPFDKDHLRPQLIDMINNHRPSRKYKLDTLLQTDPLYKDRNIEILRTPQYHPELQPIEKCWAIVKQYMAQHCDFTMKGLLTNLDEAWLKVTEKTMIGIMKKVRTWERYHFEQDDLLDKLDDGKCSLLNEVGSGQP